MHDISRRARYLFDARARSAGSTRAQWRVLFNLARTDGPTQSELADILDVERITLCRMVDRLAEAGMVERRADPSDRRVWRLHLTDRAAPVIEQLGAIADEMEDNILQPLSPAERETLTNLLIKVRDNMREGDDQPLPMPAGGR
ncbi:MarR family winged helix-turn-helix transcriptional regulator [Sphingomonas sp. SRS2]|uniref:MarR family winged helix-turn-helix transcriptional regulator n=1 Tax=Sphingomonas sp. SRS2 TaxID=133190 RepID=UPI0009FE3133|nr:MarR family transcriptional regulator [Sphingomonas sp. SRS2]